MSSPSGAPDAAIGPPGCKCRPGDIAFLIRSQHSENLGRLVRVLRHSDRMTAQLGVPTWHCRSVDTPMWAQRVGSGPRFLTMESCAEDSDLMPLNGPIPLSGEAEEASPGDAAVTAVSVRAALRSTTPAARLSSVTRFPPCRAGVPSSRVHQGML